MFLQSFSARSLQKMFRFFYTLKVDGVITDNPDVAEKAKTK
ncbi:MAG TPA: hypothetical protein VES69_12955 [Pyrinomonadaceae bacterium]|nr:hypothetical protein [Pyrinomonadaceae bacterium]